MVKIEAISKEKGVEVKTHLDGEGIDIVQESVAIVKALYNDFKENNIEMLYVLELGAMLFDWIRESDEEEGGDYA